MVRRSGKTFLLLISIFSILFFVFGCVEEESDIEAKAKIINADNIRLKEELAECREKNEQLMNKTKENIQNALGSLMAFSAEENEKLRKEVAELKKKLAEANK
jgi:hypothetical protein